MIRFPTSAAAPALLVALSIALAVPSPGRAQGDPRNDVGGAATAPGAVRDTPPPSDPWSLEVAVADRGPEERRAAQGLAMREVLLANSGDKTLLNRDDVRAGLRDAERYVERFDYRTPPPGTIIAPGTPLTDTVRDSGQATQLMRVTFDRGLLGTLIAGAEEAVAPEADADEPGDPFLAVDTALVWLLIEDGRREIMISDEAAANVRARAREIAGARGVALRYPAGDDEDRAAIDAEALRTADVERLRRASERYAVPVVLVGRLARDGLGGWEGRWTKFAGEAIEETEARTDSLDAALQEGLGWLSAAASGDDTYRYGGNAGSDAEALVWVGALDSIAAYATVMDFLAGVPGVGTVYPREIDERGMTFTVVPRGALPAIASAADALAWLRRTSPPADPVPAAVAPGAGRRGAGVTPYGREAGAARAADGQAATDPAASGSLARNAELAFDYLR